MSSILSFAGEEVDNICSKEELVTFHNIPSTYSPKSPLTVQYTQGVRVEATPKDWVGLFQTGWEDVSKPLAFLYSGPPPPKNGVKSRKRSITFSSELSKDLESFEKSYQFVYVGSNGHVMGVSQPFRIKMEEQWCDDIAVLSNQELLASCDSAGAKETHGNSAASESPVMLSSDEEWDMATQSTMKYYGSSTSDMSDIVILSPSPSKEAAQSEFKGNRAEPDSSCDRNQGSNKVNESASSGFSSDEELVTCEDFQETSEGKQEKLATDGNSKNTGEDQDSSIKSGRQEKVEASIVSKTSCESKDLQQEAISRRVRNRKKLCQQKENTQITHKSGARTQLDKCQELEAMFNDKPCPPSIFSRLKIIDSSDEEEGSIILKDRAKQGKPHKKCQIEVITETSAKSLDTQKSYLSKKSKAKHSRKKNTLKEVCDTGVEDKTLPENNTKSEEMTKKAFPTTVRHPCVLFDEMEDLHSKTQALSAVEGRSVPNEDSETAWNNYTQIQQNSKERKRKQKMKKKLQKCLEINPTDETKTGAPDLVRETANEENSVKTKLKLKPKVKPRETIGRSTELSMPGQVMKELRKKYKRIQKDKAKKIKGEQTKEKCQTCFNLAMLFDVQVEPTTQESSQSTQADDCIDTNLIQDEHAAMINSTILRDTSDQGFPALSMTKNTASPTFEQTDNLISWTDIIKASVAEHEKKPNQDDKNSICEKEMFTLELIENEDNTMREEKSKTKASELCSPQRRSRSKRCLSPLVTGGSVQADDALELYKKDATDQEEERHSEEIDEGDDPLCCKDVAYIPPYVLDIMDALPPSLAAPEGPYKGVGDRKHTFVPLFAGLPSSKFKAKYRNKSLRRQELKSLRLRKKLSINLDSGIVEKIMKTRFLGEMETQQNQLLKVHQAPQTVEQRCSQTQDSEVTSLSDYPALCSMPSLQGLTETKNATISYAGVLKKTDSDGSPNDTCIITIESQTDCGVDPDSGVESVSTSYQETPIKRSEVVSVSRPFTTMVSDKSTALVCSDLQVIPFGQTSSQSKPPEHQTDVLHWPVPTFIMSTQSGLLSALGKCMLTSAQNPATLSPNLKLSGLTGEPQSLSGSLASGNGGAYLRSNIRLNNKGSEKIREYYPTWESQCPGDWRTGTSVDGTSFAVSPCGKALSLSGTEACKDQEEQMALLDLALSASLTENRELRGRLEILEAKLAELRRTNETFKGKEAEGSSSVSSTRPDGGKSSKTKALKMETKKRKIPVFKWAGYLANLAKSKGELLSLMSQIKDDKREMRSMQSQINVLKEALQAETELKTKALSKWFKLKLKVKSLRSRLKEFGEEMKISVPVESKDSRTLKADMKHDEPDRGLEALGGKQTEVYEPPAKKRKLDSLNCHRVAISHDADETVPLLSETASNKDKGKSSQEHSTTTDASCLPTVQVFQPSQPPLMTEQQQYYGGRQATTALASGQFQAPSFSYPHQSTSSQLNEGNVTPIQQTSKLPPPLHLQENQVNQFQNCWPLNNNDGHAPFKANSPKRHTEEYRRGWEKKPMAFCQRKQSPPHLPLPTPKLIPQSNPFSMQGNSDFPNYFSNMSYHRPQSPSVKSSWYRNQSPRPQYQRSPKRTSPHPPLPPTVSSCNTFPNNTNVKFADCFSNFRPNQRSCMPSLESQNTYEELPRNLVPNVPPPKPSIQNENVSKRHSSGCYTERNMRLPPEIWSALPYFESHSDLWPHLQEDYSCMRTNLEHLESSGSSLHSAYKSESQQCLRPFTGSARHLEQVDAPKNQAFESFEKFTKLRRDVESKLSTIYQQVINGLIDPAEEKSTFPTNSHHETRKDGKYSHFPKGGAGPYDKYSSCFKRQKDENNRRGDLEGSQSTQKPPKDTRTCRPQSPYTIYTSDHEAFELRDQHSMAYHLNPQHSLSTVERGLWSDQNHIHIDANHSTDYLLPKNPAHPEKPCHEKQTWQIPQQPCLHQHQQDQQVQYSHTLDTPNQEELKQLDQGCGTCSRHALSNQSSTFFEISTGGLIDASQALRDDSFYPATSCNSVTANIPNTGPIEAAVAHLRGSN